MRILYAIDHLGPGGAQRQVVELAVQLATRVDVHVLVYHPIDFFGDHLRGVGLQPVLVPRRGRADPLFPWRWGREISRIAPDVVHAFQLGAAAWTLMAIRGAPWRPHPPVIAAERSGRVGVGRARTAIERWVYGRADAVTVNSSPLVRAMPERLGVRAERVRYLPNGIDLDRWDRARRAPCPVDLDPDLFHVALVGRLEPQKDHELLLEALAILGRDHLRDWRVWCVGGATGEPAFVRGLHEIVTEKGLRDVVRFVEPLPDVAAFMDRIDALVLPSRYEGFPNVLLEAMACGLPAVATAVGDVPNLLTPGETGWLVPPGDAETLARALRELRGATSERRREMGARARAVVEGHYAMPVVADRYLHTYREVLAGR